MSEEIPVWEYDFIRFTWSDIHGIHRGKLVPSERAAEIISSGIRVFAGTLLLSPRSEVYVPEGHYRGYCNGLAMAVPDTLKPLPWAGHPPDGARSDQHWRVGNILCEFLLADTGKPIETCTRHLARLQLEQLKKEFGYSLKSGQEHEFVIMHADSMKPTFDGPDFVTHVVHHKYEHLLYTLSNSLSKCGIKMETLLAEYGAGQFEFATIPMMGIETADASFMMKQIIKEVSLQLGYFSTFMTYPYPDQEVYSSTHFNHSLLDEDGNNVFHDEKGAHKMSSAFCHWTAGVVAHCRALAALCCPTTNCYRRIGHHFAPAREDWGFDHRESCIRVKEYGSYLENRLPSSASNSYLVMAGTVAAGMDGLRRKLDLPAEMTSDAAKLPASLEEALEALKEDEVMKLALGQNFISWFAESKMEMEVKKMQVAKEELFEKEKEMYMEFI